MTNSYHVSISQGFALPKIRTHTAHNQRSIKPITSNKAHEGLTRVKLLAYDYPTKAKSLVGISLSFYLKAHRRQLPDHGTGFFMRTIRTPLFCVNALMRSRLFFVSPFLGSRLNYGGLDGSTSVRRFLESGKANPVQSTTSKLAFVCGGLKNYLKEAATMATTPTQATFKVFTFAIINRKRIYSRAKKIRTVSTLAQSERQARDNLQGLPLAFIKRTPAKAQEVAA